MRTRPSPKVSKVIRPLCETSIVLVAVVVSTGVRDTTQLPKAALVTVLALVVVAAVAGAGFRGEPIKLPPTQLAFGVAGVLAAMVIASLASGSFGRSMVGTYSRWSGLALYVACGIFALAVAGYYSPKQAHRLAIAIAIATGWVAVYGFFQRLGVDAIDWVVVYGDKVFSSLGNPNFAGAFIGIGVPLWAWLALDGGRSFWIRVTSAGVVLMSLLVQVWAGSLQGPLVSGVGLWTLAFVWLKTREVSFRRRGRGVLLGGAGLGLAGGFAAYQGVGPLTFLDLTTLDTRLRYWRAALGMFADHPLFGVGPSGYPDFYRRHRSMEAWRLVGTNTTNDAAHSVPFDMLAGGGLVLGLAYLSLLVVVAVFLVKAVRRAEGDTVLMVGGIAGAWVGYLAQATVSIDVPAPALVGWMLSGLVVGLGGGEERIGVVFTGKHRAGLRTRTTLAGVLGALTLLALSSGWFMLRQYRADAAALQGSIVLQSSPAEALAEFERAASLAPWEPRYVFEQGNAFDEAGRLPEALEAYERAAQVDPHWWDSHIAAARLSAFLGDLDRSAEWYAQVLEIEPVAPDMKFEAGRVEFLRGEFAKAAEFLEAALEGEPDEADWWLLLAEARSNSGDEAGAEAAFATAVELNPALADPSS